MKTLLFSYYEPKSGNCGDFPIGNLHFLMKPYTKLIVVKYKCSNCDRCIIEVYACTEEEKL